MCVYYVCEVYMLTGQEKLAYAKMVGYPKEHFLLYEKDGKVFHAKRTDKPYEFQQTEITFAAPAWLPQDVVDKHIKEKVKCANLVLDIVVP